MKLKEGDYLKALYKGRIFKVVTLIPETDAAILEDDIGWPSKFRSYEIDMYFRKLIWPIRWWHQLRRWWEDI